MKLSNNVYDVVKFIAIVGLPAFTTLVGTVGVQLGYDMTTVIVILTAVDTFIGSLIGISTTAYKQAQETSAIGSESVSSGVTVASDNDTAVTTNSTLTSDIASALDEIKRNYTLEETKDEEK